MELKYQSGFELAGVSDKGSRRVYGKAIPVGENRILLVDTENRIQCFSTHDGKLLWSDICNPESGREARHDEHIVYQNGTIYSRREDKDIVAMNPADGKILWKYYGRFNDETCQGHFRFYEDRIMIFHTNNSVFALDLRRGRGTLEAKSVGTYAEQQLLLYLEELLYRSNAI